MAEFLSCEQAAAAAQCSVYKIREAIKRGEIKAYRPGKSFAVDAADLEKWVRSHAVKVRKKGDKKEEVQSA